MTNNILKKRLLSKKDLSRLPPLFQFYYEDDLDKFKNIETKISSKIIIENLQNSNKIVNKFYKKVIRFL
jgi:hypothetical protein